MVCLVVRRISSEKRFLPAGKATYLDGVLAAAPQHALHQDTDAHPEAILVVVAPHEHRFQDGREQRRELP
jgi:hypothetical protein